MFEREHHVILPGGDSYAFEFWRDFPLLLHARDLDDLLPGQLQSSIQAKDNTETYIIHSGVAAHSNASPIPRTPSLI